MITGGKTPPPVIIHPTTHPFARRGVSPWFNHRLGHLNGSELQVDQSKGG
jgi:hypothetical protein